MEKLGPWGTGVVGMFWVLATAACEKGPEPIGEPNPVITQLIANDWQSADTLISINPQTGEEKISTSSKDLRPDTLHDGTLVYQLVEHMPIFPGCEEMEDPIFCTQMKLNEFVKAKLEYPASAQARGIEGNNIATFIIGPDGRVGHTGVEQSLGDVLDQEVLLLVKRMPKWHPGFHKGKPVSVRYRLPITFSLPEY